MGPVGFLQQQGELQNQFVFVACVALFSRKITDVGSLLRDLLWFEATKTKNI